MADADGSNAFPGIPGQSRWIAESSTEDTCLNCMAILNAVGQSLLTIPGRAVPLESEEADGLFRMLMSVRDAVSLVKDGFPRQEVANG